jgi:hypothetical protein
MQTEAKGWPPVSLLLKRSRFLGYGGTCLSDVAARLLELFGSGRSLYARFPDESRTRYPLTLTVRVEAAINLVRLAYLLFAFKREAPIALTLPPRHYAAKSSTLSIALHKRRLKDFQPSYSIRTKMFRRGARALPQLTKRYPHNVLVKREESGLPVKMSSQDLGE